MRSLELAIWSWLFESRPFAFATQHELAFSSQYRLNSLKKQTSLAEMAGPGKIKAQPGLFISRWALAHGCAGLVISRWALAHGCAFCVTMSRVKMTDEC